MNIGFQALRACMVSCVILLLVIGLGKYILRKDPCPGDLNSLLITVCDHKCFFNAPFKQGLQDLICILELLKAPHLEQRISPAVLILA